MGQIRITTDATPVENLEGNILPSATRTVTNSTAFTNSAGKDLFLIVNVTGGITGATEVDSLTVTAAPTSSGNVTPTLNGTGVPVAVTIGTAEVETLTVTAIPTAVGNVTVTLNGVAVNVAVDPATDTTTALVATKIRAAVYTGWVAGGSASTVTFTKSTVGTNSAPAFGVAATGATGTIVVTTAGVAADTTTTVATKIRAASFTGFTTGGAGTTITFTATATGTKTAPSYSAGTTGATGTMTVTTTGAASGTLTPKVSGKAVTSGSLYSLGAGTAISTTGTFVYLYSKNAGAAHDGITAVFDTPVPKSLQVDMTQAGGSITYSVDYAICQ
jgi:hypothetical protein